MRKSLGFMIIASLVALSGCSLGGSAPPPQPDDQTEHGFTRGSDGQAVQSSITALEGDPGQAFDHTLTSERERDDLAASEVSCSGICDANTCLCSGDLNCCIAGCGLCFILVAN